MPRMPPRRLVRQASVPLTADVKKKLGAAKKLIRDAFSSEDETDRPGGQGEVVDASHLGVELRVEYRGSVYFYSVSQVFHATLQGYVSKGDVLMMIGKTHLTGKTPVMVSDLCQAMAKPQGSNMVFATQSALQEEEVEEVEFITLKICLEGLEKCVEAQVLGCRRWQRKVQALKASEALSYVTQVDGRRLQVDDGGRLQVVKEDEHNDHNLVLLRRQGHCNLGKAGDAKFVTTLELPGEEKEAFKCLAVQKDCVDGVLSLRFQAFEEAPIPKGNNQEIKKNARSAVFIQTQKNKRLLLQPIDFPDMTICMDSSMVLVCMTDPASHSIAYFDFHNIDLQRGITAPELKPGLPESMGEGEKDADTRPGGDTSDADPQAPSGSRPKPSSRRPSRQNAVDLDPDLDNNDPKGPPSAPLAEGDVTLEERNGDVIPPKQDNDVIPGRRPSRQDAVDVSLDLDNGDPRGHGPEGGPKDCGDAENETTKTTNCFGWELKGPKRLPREAFRCSLM